MRYPLLIVWEADGRLAALLRPLAEANRWSFREARRGDECLRLLAAAGGGPAAVLVLRVGRDLDEEFSALEEMGRRHPAASAVVVADGDQQARLVGLAWDLGAAYVHLWQAPRGGEGLPAVVAGLMNVAFLEDVE
jgi:hypothetical protein